MAIVQNFWLKGAKKRLAGAVIYKAGGQTIQRSLAESVSNPRTRSQMLQRVKWANLVSFYRANREWMRYAYETKKANQSEYNKLMSLNVSNSGIFLTKQAAAAGACVVSNYIMTQGTLPSITYNAQVDVIQTNIFIDPEHIINDDATVAEFSEQLLRMNAGLREGDQLSIIRYTQMVNESTGFPFVLVRKYEIVLSLTSQDKWINYWPLELVDTGELGGSDYLNIKYTGNAGGLLMVLSRTISGKTYVSTQSILPVDNSATIARWSGENALNAAILSYGESEDAFLSSDTANYGEELPVENVILSSVWGSNVVAPMDEVGELSDFAGQQLTLQFNQAIRDAVTAVYIDTYQTSSGGTAAQSGAQVQGNLVIIPSISQGSVQNDSRVRAVRVMFGDAYNKIEFAEYQHHDHGLE